MGRGRDGSQDPASEGGAHPEGDRWFALYTRSRHEKRVDTALAERGFDVYLPLVPRERQWHDRKKVVLFPLFPSYVFVRVSADAVSRTLRTPGVSAVVSFGDRPVAIPEAEIASVRRLCRTLSGSEGRETATPVSSPASGERVRVESGPFEGIEGIVLERRGDDRALIQIGVRAIRQAVKVEVEATALRPLE